MKKKQILVISVVVVIAALACLTTYMIVNSHEESLSTLRIGNSCTISVPATNNTVEAQGNGVSKFIFKSSNLNITHQKNGNNSEIKKIYSDKVKNSKEVESGIYYDDSTGTYFTFIENNETGDAILIEAKDLNLLKRVAKSVKFTPIKIVSNTNNTNVSENNQGEQGNSGGENNYPSNVPNNNNNNNNNNNPTEGSSNQNGTS